MLDNNTICKIKEMPYNYHKLFLIIGQSNSGKTNYLKELSNKFGSNIINLN
ncbi:hypothetical protein EDD65_1013 [Keratinibaculum paraultunense]|uniref:Uncharacterized protein n=1 Tax=Keratinibaculum paraultunense TaxID=1278232 RepID=A0A4R3L016_9FIRM|nr:hypothetical protein [Keratinibaculum paraultunense]QQY80173.1 hypothetical protein JL105_02195 [Keratinibaculum paraultunense]TCS91505.1 hypothetical protein EDD65_1013 [Keratinibaculum paraultunense]